MLPLPRWSELRFYLCMGQRVTRGNPTTLSWYQETSECRVVSYKIRNTASGGLRPRLRKSSTTTEISVPRLVKIQVRHICFGCTTTVSIFRSGCQSPALNLWQFFWSSTIRVNGQCLTTIDILSQLFHRTPRIISTPSGYGVRAWIVGRRYIVLICYEGPT